MKAWVWTALVFVVTVTVLTVSGLPWWLGLPVLVPVLVVTMVCASVLYSARPSLKPEPVPNRGYDKRVRELEEAGGRLRALDLEKVDAFYLRTLPDAVIYVFRHAYMPVYFCLYHLGSKMTCDVVSEFEGGTSLTTTASVEGGMMPRPPEKLLQIIPSASHEDLFHAHMQGHLAVRKRGRREAGIPLEKFRDHFMAEYRASFARVREMPLWPLRLIYWTVTKRGRVYQKPIAQQFQDGMVTPL